MDNTLFYIAAILGVYLVMRFSKKILSKLVGLVVFLAIAFGAAYILGLGPFQPNFTDVYAIEDKYCSGPEKDQDICDCIALPMKNVITSRFSADEVADMKEDKVKSAYVFAKTLSLIKDKSQECLKSKKREDAWKDFASDILPFKIGISEFSSLKESITNKFEKRKSEKDSIDSKFED